MSKQHELSKEQLIQKFAKEKYLCTTCDIWSSRAQAYFCMTIHFLNSEYERESFVLAFRNMKYRQTNEEIKTLIRSILREYEIDPDKVTHIVTDGGSSFTKAFKLYGKGADTLVEPIINEPAENSDEEEFTITDPNDEELLFSNVIDLESEEMINPNEDEFEYNELLVENSELMPANEEVIRSDVYDSKPLPRQRRCLSHSLNLLGTDFENNISARTKSSWIKTQSKLQSLWVFPRKSSQAKSYCKEILNCMLRVPCATRWNSKFDAVSKVLDLGFEKINLYIDTLLKNMKSAAHLSKLEKDDWVMMNLYVKVMKPIAISLDRLQAEKDSSQGFILPTLLTMKHHLLQLEGGIVLRSMRDVMLNAIDKRFGAYFQIGNSNKELVLASVSNSRF